MRTSLYQTVVPLPAFDIELRATGDYDGITVDRGYKDNFFRTSMFIIHVGTITDGTITFVMEDSDNGSSWNTADAKYMQGTLPTILAADADKVYSVGYLGPARYVRLTASVENGATGGTWGAVCINSDGRREPVTH